MTIQGASPNDVSRVTAQDGGSAGDSADQAEHLSMVMEAEAIYNALNGQSGEGSLDGLDFPLEDIEAWLSEEDADDSSDDPLHAGGLHPKMLIAAEEAAMHTVDDFDPSGTFVRDGQAYVEEADLHPDVDDDGDEIFT